MSKNKIEGLVIQHVQCMFYKYQEQGQSKYPPKAMSLLVIDLGNLLREKMIKGLISFQVKINS